jgi:FlaA1/EpsC-like NDP-sugar epimerase
MAYGVFRCRWARAWFGLGALLAPSVSKAVFCEQASVTLALRPHDTNPCKSPSLPRREHRRSVAVLQRQAIPVLQIDPIAIEDLLGPGLRDAVVCVTGAADPPLVLRLFADHVVQTVFHAAAYKHVPLVEANPLAGLASNVGSTRVVCQAAVATGVSELVLISTDKAVRPINVMGASKRLAELVVQASALELPESAKAAGRPRTRLAMVRFGNVLGSSGSVVPLFRKQIAAGGPITLTHPEIIRHFMTIPEAAQLVLQAATLAQGGDLFLLDMGEPVRIKDLAEQMVRLSGLSLRDAQNPTGEIAITCTGLRPGEKLYEELLIDAESEPTQHPLIFRAQERALPPDVLWPRLDALDAAIDAQDVEAALELLAELVPEWQMMRLWA